MIYEQIENFEEFWEAYHDENLYLSIGKGYYVESGYIRGRKTLDMSNVSTVIENINKGYYFYIKSKPEYKRLNAFFSRLAQIICDEDRDCYYKSQNTDNFIRIDSSQTLSYIWSLYNNNNIYIKEQ